jgi:fatty-acyl-CoA synthase
MNRAGCDVTVVDQAGAEVSASWADLAAAASRVGASLRQRRIGDNAVMVAPGTTAYETLVAIFGAWECGAAVSLVAAGGRRDPGSTSRDLERTVDLLGARCVYAPSPVRERIATEWSSRGRGIVVLDERIVPRAEYDRTSCQRTVDGERLADRLGRGYAPEAVAVLQATSGTTGAPRIVPVTWQMLRCNIGAVAKRLGLGARDSFVSWMPLYHDMGLVAFVLMPALLGARLALVPPESFAAAPEVFPTMIERQRGTFAGTTSSALALLERGLRRRQPPFDLSSLRSLACGAEMIDLELCERAVAAGTPHGLRPDVFSFAYGMAEATLGVSVHPPDTTCVGEELASSLVSDRAGMGWIRPRPGTYGFARTGPPLDGIDVRLVDADTGQPLDVGDVGEIEIRGPSVMRSYVGHTPAESGIDPSGWFRTGDLGFLSAGQVVIVGRRKDLIVAGGRNIVPDDVERIVGALSGIRRGRVAAVPVRGRAGEALGIVAERSAHAASMGVDERAVRLWVSRELGVIPEAVRFVPRGTLPKTTSGKLRRLACRPLLTEPRCAPTPT